MSDPAHHAGAGRDAAEREQLLHAVDADFVDEMRVRVDREGWEMLLAAVQGDGPTAYELAEYARRRAALWTRVAEMDPRFNAHAARAREHWREADVRHITAAAINHRLLPGQE